MKHLLIFVFCRDKLNASIRYVLEVTNMFPQRGSLYGGTEITIMGLGFSTIPAENTVLLGESFIVTGRSFHFSQFKGYALGNELLHKDSIMEVLSLVKVVKGNRVSAFDFNT